MPKRNALLVEDYVAMRTLLAESLTSANFDVQSCGSAGEALAKFEPGSADVLITDIDLPDRPNGVELATILRARDPGLALVFITNFSEEGAFKGRVRPPEPFAFVQKSRLESNQVLLDAVESALTEASSPLRLSDGATPLSTLTSTQLTVVRMIAAGLTNSEIASRRGTNQRAVERMISRLFAELDVANDASRNPRVVLANLYTQAFGYPVLEETP